MRQPDLDHAATLAYRCLVKLKVTALPVRPLAILHRCRDTAVYTYQQAAEQLDLSEADFDRRCGDADAFTIRGGNKYVVCYREGGNPARLNFTLAHELGHILLHHAEDTLADEAEANCFARHLLCPVPVLRGRTAEQVATMCYVSRAAAMMAIEHAKEHVPEELFASVAEQLTNEHVENKR